MYRDSIVIKTGYYWQQISNNEPKEIFYKLFNHPQRVLKLKSQ
jgi:hypothetical protein